MICGLLQSQVLVRLIIMSYFWIIILIFCVYMLRNKSEVFAKFLHFRAYVKNQFKCEVQSLQCDHGGEYDTHQFHSLFDQNGITFCLFFP